MIRLVAGVFLAAWFLGAPAGVRAEDNIPSFAVQTHAFRFILHSLQLEPLHSWMELGEDPKQTVLIVFGETHPIPEDAFRRFVEEGGAVLLAADRPSAPVVEQTFGVRVKGEVVFAPIANAEHNYKDLRDCPLLTPQEFKHDHAIFHGLNRIATNRSGHLEPTPRSIRQGRIGGKFQTMARFPEDCVPSEDGIDPEREIIRAMPYNPTKKKWPKLTFAMLREAGRKHGPALVLSDHSVFINSMMLQDDNDNFDFAYNCVKWITEDGQRRRVLFVEDGRIVETFEVPLHELPPAIDWNNLPAHPIELANRLLAKLEEHNIHNELILQQWSMNQILSAASIVLTGLLAGYGYFKLRRSRHPLEEA